jgi:hypothetical protein
LHRPQEKLDALLAPSIKIIPIIPPKIIFKKLYAIAEEVRPCLSSDQMQDSTDCKSNATPDS